MAIKNNIASTELSTDPDRILCRQKVTNMLLYKCSKETLLSRREVETNVWFIKELITKGKLATVNRFERSRLERLPFVFAHSH